MSERMVNLDELWNEINENMETEQEEEIYFLDDSDIEFIEESEIAA